MSWRIAESLEVLRRQLNTAFPRRSKLSDGGIGDAAHRSSNSDHNPHVTDKKGIGVVTARDFTHDPAGGLDCHKLAEWLVESRDPRIKYIIWNRRICSSKVAPWKWRPYAGKNAHTKHLHLSVDPSPKLFDDRREWDLDIAVVRSFADLGDEEIILELPENSAAEGSAPAVRPQQTATFELSLQQSELHPENEPEPPPIRGEGNAVETTEIVAPGQTAQITETKNEQSVNEPAQIPEPEKQGVFAKLTGGVTTLFSGTAVYTVAERFGNISISQTVLILIVMAVAVAFLGFCFWAWLDAWKQAQRVRVEADAKTSVNKKDVEWITPQ